MVRHWDAPAVLIATATLLLLAGCIGVDTDGEDAQTLQEGQALDADVQAQPEQDPMTADASEETDAGIREGMPPFYSERTITVEGRLALDALPVRLEGIDGPLEVTRGEPGQYTLEVTLTGYGVTAEQAEEERDRLALDWDIGVPGERRLHAVIQRQDTDIDEVVQANTGSWSDAMRLELPPILVENLEGETRDGDIRIDDVEGNAAVLESRDGDVMVQSTTMDALVTETRDGDIALQDARGDAIVVTTRDGDVRAQAATVSALVTETRDGDVTLQDASGDAIVSSTRDGDVTLAIVTADVDVETRDGGIDAEVVPSASGTLAFHTRDGPIDLLLPEGSTYGYQAVAQSDDGQTSMNLEDGDTTRDGDEVRFVTTGFNDRAIQTILDATTRDGDIRIGPS